MGIFWTERWGHFSSFNICTTMFKFLQMNTIKPSHRCRQHKSQCLLWLSYKLHYLPFFFTESTVSGLSRNFLSPIDFYLLEYIEQNISSEWICYIEYLRQHIHKKQTINYRCSSSSVVRAGILLRHMQKLKWAKKLEWNPNRTLMNRE